MKLHAIIRQSAVYFPTSTKRNRDLAGLTSQKKDCKPYKQIDTCINLRSSAELRVRGWACGPGNEVWWRAWEQGPGEGLGTRSVGTRSGGGPGNKVRGVAGKEIQGRAWEGDPGEGLGTRSGGEGLGARLRFSHCIAYIIPGAFEHRSAVLRGTQKLLITQTSKV